MDSFHNLVIHRRSIRQYTGELLDPDQVRMILEAGLMAPAGKRRNPWHFVVVDDPETLQKLSEARPMGTAQIAKNHGGGYLEGKHNVISSFSGIYPKSDPQIIIYASVKKPGGGSQTSDWAVSGAKCVDARMQMVCLLLMSSDNCWAYQMNTRCSTSSPSDTLAKSASLTTQPSYSGKRFMWKSGEMHLENKYGQWRATFAAFL